eukprot:5061607-Pleurochrysis_carterae.AAC.1
MVPRIVFISCRSTLASCLGEITKWSLSSVVQARTLETGAAAAGAAVGVALAGVERVAGPVAAEAAGFVGKVNMGMMGEGESIV